jgi:hypothetical protein
MISCLNGFVFMARAPEKLKLIVMVPRVQSPALRSIVLTLTDFNGNSNCSCSEIRCSSILFWKAHLSHGCHWLCRQGKIFFATSSSNEQHRSIWRSSSALVPTSLASSSSFDVRSLFQPRSALPCSLRTMYIEMILLHLKFV